MDVPGATWQSGLAYLAQQPLIYPSTRTLLCLTGLALCFVFWRATVRCCPSVRDLCTCAGASQRPHALQSLTAPTAVTAFIAAVYTSAYLAPGYLQHPGMCSVLEGRPLRRLSSPCSVRAVPVPGWVLASTLLAVSTYLVGLWLPPQKAAGSYEASWHDWTPQTELQWPDRLRSDTDKQP